MGGRILGSLTLILLSSLAWVMATEGLSEEGLRILVRTTAKLAVTLLCTAFSASSLHALLKRPWTAALMRNRREIGLSFALAHVAHLLALIAVGTLYPSPFIDELDAVLLIGGGLAYLFILLLAVTSNDAAQRRLGKNWRHLHRLGSWYILIVFTQSYVPRALADPIYVPFALLIATTMGLRFLRWRKRRRQALEVVAWKAN